MHQILSPKRHVPNQGSLDKNMTILKQAHLKSLGKKNDSKGGSNASVSEQLRSDGNFERNERIIYPADLSHEFPYHKINLIRTWVKYLTYLDIRATQEKMDKVSEGFNLCYRNLMLRPKLYKSHSPYSNKGKW